MDDEREVANTTNSMTDPGSLPGPQRNMFVGKDGLRAGWRLLIYVLIIVASSAAINMAIRAMFHPRRGVAPGVWAILAQEAVGFAIAFGVAIIMSRIERRPLGV